MEKKYESLTLLGFQRQFPDDKSCYDYLAEMKWPGGFKCERCDYTHYCKGKLDRTRQCTKCGYQATPTSNTLFHKVKFPILKALYIVYFVATNKQGISSTELSRKLGLRQKTCQSFKRKVMIAMASSQNYPLKDKVEVDETVVGQQEEGLRGRKNDKKKRVVVAIERKGRSIGRMYGRETNEASKQYFKPFFEDHIAPEAQIKTDEWTGYLPLKKNYQNLQQIPSGKKRENFQLMHRSIMLFKAWLRGTHHAVDHLQAYLDEYTYRFNRSVMKVGIFRKSP